MRTKKYPINLSETERRILNEIIRNGKNSAKKIRRANILLCLDESQGKALLQREVAQKCHVSDVTIYHVIRQYTQEGLLKTLERKERAEPPIRSKITGDVEAKIIALACLATPEGHCKWSWELLAGQAVELHIIDSISPNTVGRILKKRIKATST